MRNGRRERTHARTLDRPGGTRSTFLGFSPPCIAEEEIAEVVATLRSGWITTGQKVRRFEQEFADFLGADAAIAVSSGTAALHVALVAAGVGPGDVVITTPMTFCSSVHVIEHVGAHPLLVDVDPDTLNIDPARVAQAIKEHERASVGGATKGRLRAILPVHLYGHPCDMDALDALARDYQLTIIEDAAHALPAVYRHRTIGSGAANRDAGVRRFTCFSFYATKNMTTGEGGMLIAPAALQDEARLWTLHGMSRDAYKRYMAEGSWFYEVVRPGFKYNMSDLQAAIGLQQLRKLPMFQARRREIVHRYTEAFRACPDLQIPAEREDVKHAWHIYALRLNVERFPGMGANPEPSAVRSRFIEKLKSRNIGAGVHFTPIHLHSYYRQKYNYEPNDFPVALREYQRSVSLPLHAGMTDADVDDVIAAVRDIVS